MEHDESKYNEVQEVRCAAAWSEPIFLFPANSSLMRELREHTIAVFAIIACWNMTTTVQYVRFAPSGPTLLIQESLV